MLHSDDELNLPAAPLPPISADFVERTWRRVLADRVQQVDPEAVDEIRFAAADLQAWRVPQPSPGFVESAWRAVRRDPAKPQRSDPAPRPRVWLLAAAAAVVLGLLLSRWFADGERSPAPVPRLATSVEFTPAPWSARLARLQGLPTGHGEPDALLLAAHVAAREHSR